MLKVNDLYAPNYLPLRASFFLTLLTIQPPKCIDF